MVEIKVYNASRSLYFLGMAGQSRLAIPGIGANGVAVRMPVSRAQFENCRKELAGLCRRGAVKFEASDGKWTQAVTLEQVGEFFAKEHAPVPAPAPAPQFVEQARREIVREISKVQESPPPAPWMNPDPETEKEIVPQ
jgi:hypothetical protein